MSTLTFSAPVRTLADIQALERRPWQSWLTAASTYALLGQAAARHPERIALRFLPPSSASAIKPCSTR